MLRRVFAFFAVSATIAGSLFGQSAAPVTSVGPLLNYTPPAGAEMKVATLSDLTLASPRLRAEHHVRLPELTSVERQKLASGSDSEKGAMVVGVVRPLVTPIIFTAAPSMDNMSSMTLGAGLLERSGTKLVWTTALSSRGAGALRMRFTATGFAPGSVAYVYSARGEVHGPYDLTTTPADGAWSNTVFAEEMMIELQLPTATPQWASFVVTEVVHIENEEFAPKALHDKPVTALEDSCFVDASCVSSSEWSSLPSAARAIAAYVFMKGGTSYVCSGGLLNDMGATGTPYFLTANHCFTTQSSADSMELFWKYQTPICNGSVDPATRPRTTGATLLATNAGSDFTFLRLKSAAPANSAFLGWDGGTDYSTRSGTKIYRLHHPGGDSLHYSRHSVIATPTSNACWPTGHLYAVDEYGGTAGGSSGSPVMLSDLKVVGQLHGGCGPDPSNNCDRRNWNVDGAFKTTYPSIMTWLNPGGGGTPTTCTPNSTTACLLDGRFRVSIAYLNQFANPPQPGNFVGAKLVPGLQNPDVATFGISGPQAIEVVVRVQDARPYGFPRFDVYYGGLTDLEYTVTVTDVKRGFMKTYRNAPGTVGGGVDRTSWPAD